MVATTEDRITAEERAFAARYPRMYAALLSLGKTNVERARALGLKRRQFHEVKQGTASLKLARLEKHPTLARAWLEDVEALRGADKAA